jgi:hypothetical protein
LNKVKGVQVCPAKAGFPTTQLQLYKCSSAKYIKKENVRIK